jgi:hypothetical protein
MAVAKLGPCGETVSGERDDGLGLVQAGLAVGR